MSFSEDPHFLSRVSTRTIESSIDSEEKRIEVFTLVIQDNGTNNEIRERLSKQVGEGKQFINDAKEELKRRQN